MSRGLIIDHLGDGKYRIKQKYAVDRIQQELARQEKRLAELATEIPQAKMLLISAKNDVETCKASINLTIPDYQAGVNGAKEKITSLQSDLVKAQADLRLAELKVAELIAENLALLKRRHQLQLIPEDRELIAWCADYSEDLTGEVGLVDVNDEGGRGTLIEPGFEGAATYSPEAHGGLFPRVAQTAYQSYFNAALLPGVQKWMPRYRLAKVLEVEGDVCSVELLPAKSSAQQLPINESPTLKSIPIQYMDCDGDAFESGDEVLVRFFKQGPQVVGFSANPKPCSVDLLWSSDEYYGELGTKFRRTVRRGRVGKKPLETTPSRSDIYELTLYGDRAFFLTGRDERRASISAFPSTWILAGISAIKNAHSGREEVWVIGSVRQQDGGQYDPDDEIWTIVRVFTLDGHHIEDRKIYGDMPHNSNYRGLQMSPNYYAVLTKDWIDIRRISNDSTVIVLPIGDAVIPGVFINGIASITDEIFAWTDRFTVHCYSVPDFQAIPISIDTAYLYSGAYPMDDSVNMIGVALSDDGLTVFGTHRLIHYRVERNESGKPVAFSEFARHEWLPADLVSSVYLVASADQSRLRAITPP